jgi:hypothetical protein
MPWCPKCISEYKSGVAKCADCGAKLVKVKPKAKPVPEKPPEFVKISEGPVINMQMLRGALEQQGIQARIDGTAADTVLPMEFGTNPGAQLMVPADQAKAARKVLSKFKK